MDNIKLIEKKVVYCDVKHEPEKNEPISNFYLKVAVTCSSNWCLQYDFEFNKEFIKWKKILNCSKF